MNDQPRPAHKQIVCAFPALHLWPTSVQGDLGLVLIRTSQVRISCRFIVYASWIIVFRPEEGLMPDMLPLSISYHYHVLR